MSLQGRTWATTVYRNDAGSLSTQYGNLLFLSVKNRAPVCPRGSRKGEKGPAGVRDLSTREVGARLPELVSMVGAGEKRMMPGLGWLQGRLEVQL